MLLQAVNFTGYRLIRRTLVIWLSRFLMRTYKLIGSLNWPCRLNSVCNFHCLLKTFCISNGTWGNSNSENPRQRQSPRGLAGVPVPTKNKVWPRSFHWNLSTLYLSLWESCHSNISWRQQKEFLLCSSSCGMCKTSNVRF